MDNMTSFPEASLLSTETFLVKGRANCDLRGPGGCQTKAFGRLVMRSASRGPPFRQPVRTLPSIQPCNEKTSVLPPLGGNHVHHQENMQLFGFSEMLSGDPGWRPFTLSYSERYKPKVNHAAFFPSTLVLQGLSTFPVQNCKYSRAKVNYPAYDLPTVKDNVTSQSYTDPVMGASCSFLHRISELSCLEGETVRQEKLKRTRMSRKASSS
ncbi:putative uncharacterized protein C8orf89 homolog isoform X2 [Hippocampus comes]|uniref:putative uncharacterized protein C8orf89 homolog isoform X2 n=1 Tax=Hippocampus comes TaxID=109280 RepID=UPI00094E6DC0|nr:PREDICTED: uncharacterized protein LOC109516999 isoform X2 [Hippocampus comes]